MLADRISAALKRPDTLPSGHGRGVVIVGGGEYLASAYIAIRHLRRTGCRLPVQLWYLGRQEIPPFWRELTDRLGVESVDAFSVKGAEDFDGLQGWQCKVHALAACPFAQVLLLDADNIPLRDPTFLFDSEPFTQYGQIFWPDFRYGSHHQYAIRERAWRELGLDPQRGVELESGQLLIDRKRCWRELQVCRAMNVHSRQVYGRWTWGDKDTFTLAWLLTGRRYFSIPLRPKFIEQARSSVLWQYWIEGGELFQHQRKWVGTPEEIRPQLLGKEQFKEESLRYLQEFWEAAKQSSWKPTPRHDEPVHIALKQTSGTGNMSATELANQARAALQQGDVLEATRLFERAVQLEPLPPAGRRSSRPPSGPARRQR